MTTTLTAPAIRTTAPTITAEEFAGIRDLLYALTGIRLVAGKEALVMSRLDRRLRHLDLDTYHDYLTLLDAPGQEAELSQAIDLLTTNETYFFREERHFDFLRDTVLPAHRPGRPFRLWSAASSSGEEAYSAAMVLADHLPGQRWEVVGSDISSRVLQNARQGVYPITAAERIPSALVHRHCRKGRDEYGGMMSVSPELRSRVRFLRANLMEDLTRFGRFDVIFLRNVMIYFDHYTKAELISRVQRMLYPGGYLIVSLAETLTGIPTWLRLVEPSIYRLPEVDDESGH